MRLAVFVFSLVLIFVPTYAHALFWIGAAKGMVVRTTAGQFLKVGSKKAFAGAMMMAGAKGLDHSWEIAKNYCTKTKKCSEFLDEAEDLLFDDDPENNTYKDLLFTTNQGGYREFDNPVDMCRYYMSNVYPQTHEVNLDDHQVYGRGGKDYKVGDIVTCSGNIKFLHNMESSFSFDGQYGNVIAKPKNEEDEEAKEKAKKEAIQKIVNNLSDDDVTYIINNYGDDIEIQKYCSENACDELSKEFGDDVTKNKGKYDIDKINKANCLVENGKIVSCDNAKLEKDEENQENTEEKSNTEETTDKTNCDDNASAFHKKVCDFIDWYQSDEYQEQDTKIDFGDDKPKTSNKELDFIGACPTPYQLEFKIDFGSIGSYDVNLMLFDSLKICGFLDTWVKPIMMFLGPLHAIYILGRNE